MPPRIKSSTRLWLLSLLIACCMVLGNATDSYAQNNPYITVPGDIYYIYSGGTGPICSAYVDPVTGFTYPLQGLTARFVNCILGTVSWVANRYLVVFGDAFIATVNVLMLLAVIFAGFMAFTGRGRPVSREMITTAIKIGAVAWLINMAAFANLFPAVLYTIEWLVGLVTQYTAVQLGNQCPYSPFIWNRIDCALNLLIGGMLPGTTIFAGVFGMVATLLFSSGVGVGLFFFLMAIIISIIKAIFEAMFILLSAYIAIALLVVIAPLMIPLILFRATKAYFDKWLRLVIGVMLQPLFLFAYLTIFLIVVELSLFSGPFSVYHSIACNYANSPGFNVGQYMWGSGAVGERSGASAPFSVSMSQSPRTFEGTPHNTALQYGGPVGNEAVKRANNNTQPFSIGSFLNTDFAVSALDFNILAANCGVSPLVYIIRLILSLFTAMAVIYIFTTMLHQIPYLGTLISGGELFSLPNLMKGATDKITGHKLAEKTGFKMGDTK